MVQRRARRGRVRRETRGTGSWPSRTASSCGSAYELARRLRLEVEIVADWMQQARSWQATRVENALSERSE
jgi:hypothetical protein